MSYANAFFDHVSGNSVLRAVDNFNNLTQVMVTPYYNLLSNMKAVGHPVCHAFQFFMNLNGFAQSLFGVIESLALRQSVNENRALSHLGLFAAAAVLELANIVLSVISLATRLAASLLNFGYTSTRAPLGNALGFETCTPTSISVTDSKKLDDSTHQAAFRLVF